MVVDTLSNHQTSDCPEVEIPINPSVRHEAAREEWARVVHFMKVIGIGFIAAYAVLWFLSLVLVPITGNEAFGWILLSPFIIVGVGFFVFLIALFILLAVSFVMMAADFCLNVGNRAIDAYGRLSQ